jgi:hypothetical protein
MSVRCLVPKNSINPGMSSPKSGLILGHGGVCISKTYADVLCFRWTQQKMPVDDVMLSLASSTKHVTVDFYVLPLSSSLRHGVQEALQVWSIFLFTSSLASRKSKVSPLLRYVWVSPSISRSVMLKAHMKDMDRSTSKNHITSLLLSSVAVSFPISEICARTNIRNFSCNASGFPGLVCWLSACHASTIITESTQRHHMSASLPSTMYDGMPSEVHAADSMRCSALLRSSYKIPINKV